jgi:REP element-mobilizing transposase RayT
VTVRVRKGLPSLRSRRFVLAFRASLADASERGSFRVVHYSLQRDHVHLIVEAAGKAALGSGMKSISARLARCVNRVFARSGPVLDGRYHLRVLKTPREVRNALAYVLLNARKHWKQRWGVAPPVRLDEASSSRWFDGWRRPPDGPSDERTREQVVASAHSWLLRTGWRRHGLVDPAEVPGTSR